MKEYFEIQKDPSTLMSLIIVGIVSVMISIILLCIDYIILGIIFAVGTVVGITLSLYILITNCKISKIRINANGIRIKEKAGFKFIPWEEFTTCEVEHMSRGVYKFVLMVGEIKYTLYNVKDVLEKLICYCSVTEFAKIMKTQLDKA